MSRRRIRTTAIVLAALGASAFPGRGAELFVDQVGLARGEVVARVRVVELLDTSTRNAVASGLPITVRFGVDLWRDRRRWFDEHVDGRFESYRIRWDPRERWYTLAHPGSGRRVDTYERLDDLLADLSVRDLPVHPRGALEPGSRYFVVVEVAVRPLTLEEFRELDGWIGGKLRGAAEPEDAPRGSSEGLPGAVLDFLLGMAGFGDRILQQRTPPFRPAELVPLTGPPPAP